MCRAALEPFAGPLDSASLNAITGAGEALARGTLTGTISAARARVVLTRVVIAIATETPPTNGKPRT
jgi:hypothetical protein